MSLPVRVRAPATTANLGSGFDCAGAALDLWNELEVSEGDGVEVRGEGAGEISEGPEHLGLRAFGCVAPVEGKRFVFTNRIPLARGLGSSASTIALGLVAASLALGRWPEVESLLELGLALEPHADNLAPALAGGVCLTWCSNGRQRVARITQELPLVPIAVVPGARGGTPAAPARRAGRVPPDDAADTVGGGAPRGGGLVTGSVELLREAFDDRLHEPYRGPLSPPFRALREQLPGGAVAATISGSGPTVIVWAREGEGTACAGELAERFPDARVLQLAVVPMGAGPLP
ncbi:MAG: homoserine kinase [Thermoleophilia bacterium]|nr:homoserine kinase [Thermoleophilia bacterium]